MTKLAELYRSIYIGLEMTRCCNMNCFYCHVRRQPHDQCEMNETEWRDLLEPLLAYLKDYRVSMHLAGGEPFLFSGAVPLLHFLLDHQVFASVVSNGLILPDAIVTAPVFRDPARFVFNISLDGASQAHQTARRDYPQVMDSLTRLLEAGVPTVVRTTAHRHNLPHLHELQQLLDELGRHCGQVVQVEVQPVAGCPNASIPGFDKFRLDLDEYLSVAWTLKQQNLRTQPGVRMRWRFLDEMIFAFAPHVEPQRISVPGAMFGCCGGLGCEIHANGEVARCEMDKPMANLRHRHSHADYASLFAELESSCKPQRQCLLCTYRWSCGMCRLAPVMHGYTSGFGYRDCQQFMQAVQAWHQQAHTDQITHELQENSSK